MLQKNLMKMAWDYAAVAVEQFGGKKSAFFQEALKILSGENKRMISEGFAEDAIRAGLEGIIDETRFQPIARDRLPVLKYGKYFQRGRSLYEYTLQRRGGYSFWFVNCPQRTGSDDMNIAEYEAFEDATSTTVEEFFTDEKVIKCIERRIKAVWGVQIEVKWRAGVLVGTRGADLRSAERQEEERISRGDWGDPFESEESMEAIEAWLFGDSSSNPFG